MSIEWLQEREAEMEIFLAVQNCSVQDITNHIVVACIFKTLAVEWIIFVSAFQAVILGRWWEILSLLKPLRFREESQKGERVGASFLVCLLEGREPFPLLPIIRTVSQLVAQQRWILTASNLTHHGKSILFIYLFIC